MKKLFPSSPEVTEQMKGVALGGGSESNTGSDVWGSVDCLSVDSVLTTHELAHRPSRPPDYEGEIKVFTSLMHEMAGAPESILRLLADSALKLCRAHSSGISLLEEENGRKVFRWRAVAGKWAGYLGGTMPREASPCGTVLDRNTPLLFSHPERHFPIPPEASPAPVEVLLIPFHFGDEPIGTIWIIAHDESRQFDAEDERILSSLGKFASMAYQVLSSRETLKTEMEARRQAEAERELSRHQQRHDHELLQRLIELSPVAIAIVRGHELEFTLANPTFQAINGSAQSIVGRTLPEVLPEAVKLGTAKRLRDLILTGQSYKIRNYQLCRQNTETWWEGEALPLINAAGEVDSALILAWEITDRRRAEEALRESENRFRQMIDSMPAAIYTTDPEGRITHFNPAAAEIAGRVPELQADNWCVSWKLYHPDKAPMAHNECPMAIALKQGQAIRGAEAMLERPDGTRISFIAYPTPLRDTQGKIVGGINMLVDITERKRAETATASLAAIVASSDDAIVGKDLNGVISSWNKSAERLFGYTAEEAIGRSVTILFPPERLHEETMILSKVRRGEPVDHFETVRVRKDGSLVEISLTTSPIKDSRGQVIGASKIARDITQRKRAQDALRESEERFRTLFESAPMAIFVCDQNAVIQNYNRRAAELWGRRPTCGVDKHCGSVRLWLPDGTPLPHSQSPIVEVLRTGVPALNVEVFIERPDGSRLPVLVNFAAFKNTQGDIVGAVTSFTDITQRKQAEETMREAKELLANQAASLERLVEDRTAALRETVVDLEAFSYSVAHDMRAPLRAMQGLARLLVDEHSQRLDETAIDFLHRIIRSSLRLDRLIQDVLSYTKILRADFPLEYVDLDHLFRDIISSYADFHSSKANVTVEGKLPGVVGNEAWLTQCLSNLLSNAVKFVPPGVTAIVKVSAEFLNGHVRIWIKDNGIGIDSKDKDRVFRLFEKIHHASEYEGTGIGLTIARKAVERMNGRIGFESELGKGSRFWIELRKA